MAIELKGWRSLAGAVLLQALQDAGGPSGKDVQYWAAAPVAEAWCEVVDVSHSTFLRAAIVRTMAGGRRIRRTGRGFIVLPDLPEEDDADQAPAGAGADSADEPPVPAVDCLPEMPVSKRQRPRRCKRRAR